MKLAVPFNSSSFSDKLDSLKANLLSLNSVIILFSGGLDSSFLLHIAAICLPKERIVAAIGISASLPQSELKSAIEFAKEHKIELIKLYSDELENPNYVKNSGDRCYHCKSELNKSLNDFLETHNIYKSWSILDGIQASDDISDRPGVQASNKFGVLHPLKDANILKGEIREYFHSIGHEISNKPQSACLASRFMIGTKVTEELLNLVEEAERIIFDHGFSNFRVRIHSLSAGTNKSEILARIEFTDVNSFYEFKEKNTLISSLNNLGFSYLTLDLTGYKTGGFSNTNNTIIKNLRIIS